MVATLAYLRFSDCRALRSQRVYIAVTGDDLADLKIAAFGTKSCITATPAPSITACTKIGDTPTCPPESWTIMLYLAAEYARFVQTHRALGVMLVLLSTATTWSRMVLTISTKWPRFHTPQSSSSFSWIEATRMREPSAHDLGEKC